MKFLFCFCAVIAILSFVRGERQLFVEEPGEWVKCSAFAALKIRLTHGSCSGTATADCTAVAESETVVAEFREVFQEFGPCETINVHKSLRAVAEAIARVWVSALVKIDCRDSTGFGCGWAIANGDAWAASFAKAIIRVITYVANDKLDAICIQDLEVLSGVFAEAAAKARADACTKGGTAISFRKQFSETISTAIVTAFTNSFVSVCDKNNLAKSVCSGGGTSTGEVKTGEGGIGNGQGSSTVDGGKMKHCEDVGGKKCCALNNAAKKCFCDACEFGKPYNLITINGPEGRRIWELPKGTQCFCPAA